MALVIGANDVVNPAARERPGEPDLRHADPRTSTRRKSVIVLKRSMNAGLRGHRERAVLRPEDAMLFGDAKSSVVGLVEELKKLASAGQQKAA